MVVIKKAWVRKQELQRSLDVIYIIFCKIVESVLFIAFVRRYKILLKSCFWCRKSSNLIWQKIIKFKTTRKEKTNKNYLLYKIKVSNSKEALTYDDMEPSRCKRPKMVLLDDEGSLSAGQWDTMLRIFFMIAPVVVHLFQISDKLLKRFFSHR